MTGEEVRSKRGTSAHTNGLQPASATGLPALLTSITSGVASISTTVCVVIVIVVAVRCEWQGSAACARVAAARVGRVLLLLLLCRCWSSRIVWFVASIPHRHACTSELESMERVGWAKAKDAAARGRTARAALWLGLREQRERGRRRLPSLAVGRLHPARRSCVTPRTQAADRSNAV